MSELNTQFPQSPETGPEGFLGLYHAHTGEVIPASPEDLLQIEGHDIERALSERVFGPYIGDFHTSAVLISNRPGYITQALLIDVWPGIDTKEEWEVAYLMSGVAAHPEWDLDNALEHIKRNVEGPHGPMPATPIADNVEALIREHVAYRKGKNPDRIAQDLWGVTTHDEDSIRRNLTALSDVDPGDVLAVSGETTMTDLILAVAFYCGAAGLDGREDEVLARILPDDQQERIGLQLDVAAPALSGGEQTAPDLDDELKKLTGEA